MAFDLVDASCVGLAGEPLAARARLLSWLAQGAREATWAVCAVPRSRWGSTPPASLAAQLGTWPATRHVHHLALRERLVTLPMVRAALGEAAVASLPSQVEFERLDAAWTDAEGVHSDLRSLGEARLSLLELLESARDDAWNQPLPTSIAPRLQPGAEPVGLAWLVARAYQHELEHLNALWKIALTWDRVPPAEGTATGLRLHPADRMESLP